MDSHHARTIAGLPILMSVLVVSALVGCSDAGRVRMAAAPPTGASAASPMSARQLALAASALPDFTVVEDRSRSIDDVAALYPDPAASAAELSAHGFRESWQREFVRPAGVSGHATRMLSIVSIYDQETGSRWALRHNAERIRSLPLANATAVPFSLGDESYAYSLEFAGPMIAITSTGLYIRVANVSYTLVETGVAADVDPAALIELACSQLRAVIDCLGRSRPQLQYLRWAGRS
jgi:hypothetical protein